jgi:hypothetical protein
MDCKGVGGKWSVACGRAKPPRRSLDILLPATLALTRLVTRPREGSEVDRRSEMQPVFPHDAHWDEGVMCVYNSRPVTEIRVASTTIKFFFNWLRCYFPMTLNCDLIYVTKQQQKERVGT